VNYVVLGVRSSGSGSEPQHLAVKFEVGRWIVSEEVVTLLNCGVIQNAEPSFGIMPIPGLGGLDRPVLSPFRTPLEGAHNAIIGPETEAVFPILHPAAVNSSHP
jgi:hypothetical protein